MAEVTDGAVIRLSLISDKETLMEIVNEVYDQCEGHLWVKKQERLTEEQFMSYHHKKELLIAEVTGSRIVGCVVMSKSESDVRELSMLVVKPDFRSRGIGRQLVDFVINKARKDKCRCVRLTQLYSTHQPDPWKKGLRKWYESIGFQFVKNEDFLRYNTDFNSADLTQEVTFSIFEKPL